MSVTILAIESSCDDTSAAIFRDGQILSNETANQEIHKKYGGVVPELAARAHQQNIIPVVDWAIKKANIEKKDIDAVAFTQGPGLLGPLLIGATFAKSFALALKIPLIAVNHMQAHILAHFIDAPKPQFPFLCLTVSGGHTQLVKVSDYQKFEVIGETLDDAAGEAFDKIGKMLGLEYPAGPLVDKMAQKGDAQAFNFTKSRVPKYTFSFSGIKTSVLYFLQKQVKENPDFIEENLADLCATVQRLIVEMLMEKLIAAAKYLDIKEIAIAGGVAANSGLRKAVQTEAQKQGWNTYIPQIQYCTDNAAMIAMTAYYKYLKKDFVGQSTIPKARFKVDSGLEMIDNG